METIDDIRRNNLKLLEEEAGSQKALAAKLEKSESQVSQWKLGAINSGTGKPRCMRSSMARYIESRTGKPSGWMDQRNFDPKLLDGSLLDDDCVVVSNTAPGPDVSHLPASPDSIRIEEYDVRFAMGDGQVAPDYPEVIRIWEVSQDWLRMFLPDFRGNPDTLKIARGIGDCLRPFYNNGDQLLIDVSYRQQVPRMAARYAFRWQGLLYAKELRPLGAKGADAFERDGVKAFSIDYEKDDFELIAKIEKAWRME